MNSSFAIRRPGRVADDSAALISWVFQRARKSANDIADSMDSLILGLTTNGPSRAPNVVLQGRIAYKPGILLLRGPPLLGERPMAGFCQR